MDRIRRDTLLGLVFFGTLAFLLWATVNLTDLADDKVRLKVWFDQAGGCEPGVNVLVLGKKVGKVGAVDVDYERTSKPVQMTLLLREDVPLREGYQIVVRADGVLGGKIVYVDPGKNTSPRLPAGGDLLGEVELNAFEQIGRIADGEGPVGGNLNGALANIREFFGKLSQGEGSIAQLINSGEFYERLNEAALQLRDLLAKMQNGEGAIGKLVADNKVGDDVATVIANLRTLSEKLNTAESGPLGVLVNDRATAANLRTIVDDLAVMMRDLRDGEGAIGSLLRPGPTSDRITRITENLDTLFANAVDPNKGAIGALVSDAATAENLKMTIANLRLTTDQLTRNDGLIGALINDKDMAVRFRRILNQVSRSIEDAREAAPIGNFVQVLLGTF
jgi:phospholipid/cholesterol/gamma-HCH transport system substrate-binding protein